MVGHTSLGIFALVNPMVLARRVNEFKRGAAQVAADAANMSTPEKLRTPKYIVPPHRGVPNLLAIHSNLFRLLLLALGIVVALSTGLLATDFFWQLASSLFAP